MVQTPSSAVTNDVKMFAAGFVEGILTCIRLSQYFHNTHKLMLIDEKEHNSLMNIKQMVENEVTQMKTMANMVAHIQSEEPADPYWKHSRYVLWQLWGLTDGYNFAAEHFGTHTLSLVDMVILNSGGELPELMEAF